MPKGQKRKRSSKASRKTSKRQKTSRTLRYPGAGASLGSVLGGAVGGAPGAAIGSMLGGGLHSLVHAVTGLGDYTVDSNTLLMDGAPIHIVNSTKTAVTIRHREYIKDIISSATPGEFQNDAMIIQPADPETFPWLASIAENFQEYKLRGMIFEFKSFSADALNSTNTALGSVIMATNYNPVLPAFTNKWEMEQYQFVTNGRPSANLLHPIECAPSETPLDHLYIRTGKTEDGLDPRFYDFGKFQIATQGMQGASVNVGELWCTYEVDLYKPRSSPTGVGGAMKSAIWRSNEAMVTTGSAFVGMTPVPENTLDLDLNLNKISFLNTNLGACFFLDFFCTGLETVIALTTTLVDLEITGINGSQVPANSGVSDAFKYSQVFRVTGPNPSLTIGDNLPSDNSAPFTGSRLLEVTCWDAQVSNLPA